MSSVAILDPDPRRRARRARTRRARKKSASIIYLDPEPRRRRTARRGIFGKRFWYSFLMAGISSFVLNKLWEWLRLPGYGQTVLGIGKYGVGADDLAATAIGAGIGGFLGKNWIGAAAGSITSLLIDKYLLEGMTSPTTPSVTIQRGAPSGGAAIGGLRGPLPPVYIMGRVEI
jgi:hypothetical protein